MADYTDKSRLHGELSEHPRFSAEFSSRQPRFTAEMTHGPVYIGGGDPYPGPYEFTPTENEQIIPIAEKTAAQNIVVHKIPSNWGKIAWDGVTLSVT